MDHDHKQLRFVMTPSKDCVNHFGTVHGGFISAMFDELASMLSYQIYGTNATATESLRCQFLGPARPGQELRFSVYIMESTHTHLSVWGIAKSATRTVAEMDCVLLRRDTRTRSS